MKPLSPISSLSPILSVAVTLALLASFCLAPVEGTSPPGVHLPRQQRSSTTISRPHCQTRGSCHFYSHCLEPEFPCGEDGFTISYAKERCHVIRMLRGSGVGRMARTWALSTETCFQKKLVEMLDRYQTKRHPDPQTCLHWEQDAIAEMNRCYTEGNLKNELLRLPEKDIRKMVKLFRVGGDYYNSTVDTGLVEVFENTHPNLTASLQSRASTSVPNRIILCIQANKYKPNGIGEGSIDPTPEEIIDVISSELDRNGRENFYYAGPDQFDDMDTPSGLCFNRSNENVNTNDYHLVTWFAPNPNQRTVGSTHVMYKQKGIFVNAAIFELTSKDSDNNHHQRQHSRCGDGIRQVSEECDLTANYPSCTLDCRVRDGHDCTVEKLEPSECWMEICGDGLRTLGEECDDGNYNNTDGCSNSCKIESISHSCTDDYNKTSDCAPLVVIQVPQQMPAKLTSQQSTGIVSARQSLAVSGETAKRTVESAANGCAIIRYSLWWALVGLLSVSVLTWR